MRAGRMVKVVTVLWLLTSIFVFITFLISTRPFSKGRSKFVLDDEDFAFRKEVTNEFDDRGDASMGGVGVGLERDGVGVGGMGVGLERDGVRVGGRGTGAVGRGGVVEGNGLKKGTPFEVGGRGLDGKNKAIPVAENPNPLVQAGIHTEDNKKDIHPVDKLDTKRPGDFHKIQRFTPIKAQNLLPVPYGTSLNIGTAKNISKLKPPLKKSDLLSRYSKYRRDGAKSLWPVDGTGDRVVDQLYYYKDMPQNAPKKVIFTDPDYDLYEGQSRFISHECPINTCTITFDEKQKASADLILFKDFAQFPDRPSTNPNQVTLLFMLESPAHTITLSKINFINWTASYRSDSVLNAPYERFTYFKNFTRLPKKPDRNYAEGKTKKVAWFVSNCMTMNGRENYAEELSKYIDVDIFGACGTQRCLKDSRECSDMLKRDYKFYLSFENSNCKDYITEKFFVNALSNDVIPIVMGAPKEDYDRLAPIESFIHVDSFKSPKHLAKYLHRLDQNDKDYNRYFRWKGTGEFIDTKFWCRLCNLLHEMDDSHTRIWYNDLDRWWRGGNLCAPALTNPTVWSSWRNSVLQNATFSRAVKNTFKILQP